MMQRTVLEKAYAKLNLSLDVQGKRPDGYHEMVQLIVGKNQMPFLQRNPNRGLKTLLIR